MPSYWKYWNPVVPRTCHYSSPDDCNLLEIVGCVQLTATLYLLETVGYFFTYGA